MYSSSYWPDRMAQRQDIRKPKATNRLTPIRKNNIPIRLLLAITKYGCKVEGLQNHPDDNSLTIGVIFIMRPVYSHIEPLPMHRQKRVLCESPLALFTNHSSLRIPAWRTMKSVVPRYQVMKVSGFRFMYSETLYPTPEHAARFCKKAYLSSLN